jgi:hypothetical protein
MDMDIVSRLAYFYVRKKNIYRKGILWDGKGLWSKDKIISINCLVDEIK